MKKKERRGKSRELPRKEKRRDTLGGMIKTSGAEGRKEEPGEGLIVSDLQGGWV